MVISEPVKSKGRSCTVLSHGDSMESPTRAPSNLLTAVRLTPLIK